MEHLSQKILSAAQCLDGTANARGQAVVQGRAALHVLLSIQLHGFPDELDRLPVRPSGELLQVRIYGFRHLDRDSLHSVHPM